MSMTAKKWSVSALAVELRMDRRRIARQLSEIEPCGADGHGNKYFMADACRALFNAGDLDGPQEKAKLDQKKREKLELEIAEKKRELLPADEVRDAYSKLVMNARGRLLALPNLVAPLVAVESDVPECEKIVKERVYEALTELTEGESDSSS